MNRKTLLFGVVLATSIAAATPAQAHDDYGYPLGLMSGMMLGIYLDGNDHHRDHRHHFYRHREYRRHDSHGYRHRDRYKHHRDREYRHHGDHRR